MSTFWTPIQLTLEVSVFTYQICFDMIFPIKEQPQRQLHIFQPIQSILNQLALLLNRLNNNVQIWLVLCPVIALSHH